MRNTLHLVLFDNHVDFSKFYIIICKLELEEAFGESGDSHHTPIGAYEHQKIYKCRLIIFFKFQ